MIPEPTNNKNSEKLQQIDKNKNSNIKNILQSDWCKKVPPFNEFKRFILEEYEPVQSVESDEKR